MSGGSRTTLGLVVSLVLFSAVAVAHTGGNNTDKDKEHHSRISKLAFWHHHKSSDKSAQTVKAKQALPTQAKAAQTRSALATSALGKKDQNQEQHAKSKAPAKKTSTATKTKPPVKTQSRKAASLKQ